MTRAIYRTRKWADLAIDLKIGQCVRLYELTDVTSLCNAIRRRGDQATYKRDRHGFKVAKVERA